MKSASMHRHVTDCRWSVAVVLTIVLSLASCGWGDYYVVDFSGAPDLDSTMFCVSSQRLTDLSAGVPDDCYLPQGVPLNQWSDTVSRPHKTSSITAAGLSQALLDKMNARSVIEISGIYPSVDKDGNPIKLSGKVLLPADGKFDRYILVSHYTIGANNEAPSNAFPLEGLLCGLGYAIICPDYIGYGITSDKIHPYLVMTLTATNVLDMYYAVKAYFDYAGLHPKHDDIYLMGYSQGGATTMAVEYMIEEVCNQYMPIDRHIDIRRVFAGGGPYDIKATFDRFVRTDRADYPVAVPLVLQGMIDGNGLDLDMRVIMQDWLCDKVDEWVNSKRFTTGQINSLIGTNVTHKMLTDVGMDVQSKEVSELYKAMVTNSIVSYAWIPQAPVYIMHSIDDETVTFVNATNAKQRWMDANIQYNFGHYGGHVKTCLRFLLTVKTMLEQDQKDEEVNYIN